MNEQLKQNNQSIQGHQSENEKKKRKIDLTPIHIPQTVDSTITELSQHGSIQYGNMIINEDGFKVINDGISHMSIQSIHNLGTNHSRISIEPGSEQIGVWDNDDLDKLSKAGDGTILFQQDSDGFKMPLPKSLKNQASNKQQQSSSSQSQEEASRPKATSEEQKDQVDGGEFFLGKDREQKQVQIQSFTISIKELKVLKMIGQGSSGLVQQVLHEPTGIIVALKTIPLNTDESFKKQINQELNTLISCDCEYIVKCYGAYLQQGMIHILMEYMDMGTLGDIMKKVKRIPEVILGLITVQVLKGMEYLHKKMKVIHRDIKPSNLLINSQGKVKIADFGVSGKLESTTDQKNTWVGTVTYMSPERFRGENYTADTDLWSLGLTLVECAWGRYPYPEDGTKKEGFGFWELLDQIQSRPSPKLPEDFSDEMQDFVNICLNKNTGSRQTATTLLQHPLVQLYEKLSLNKFVNWLKPLQQMDSE